MLKRIYIRKIIVSDALIGVFGGRGGGGTVKKYVYIKIQTTIKFKDYKVKICIKILRRFTFKKTFTKKSIAVEWCTEFGSFFKFS